MVGTAWNCRSWSRRNAAPPAGGVASSETRPKMTNRFWDGYEYSQHAPALMLDPAESRRSERNSRRFMLNQAVQRASQFAMETLFVNAGAFKKYPRLGCFILPMRVRISRIILPRPFPGRLRLAAAEERGAKPVIFMGDG